MTWFDRQGKARPVTKDAKDYLPGDVVAWQLDNGLPHIGMVSKIKVEGTGATPWSTTSASARGLKTRCSCENHGHYRGVF